MRTRHGPSTIAGIAIGALVVSVAAGPAAGPATAAPSRADAALSLVAAAPAVTLEHLPGDPTYLDVGAHIVAGRLPFEIRLKRPAYAEPIQAKQWITEDGETRKVNLPAGLAKDFTGFSAFTHVTVKDASGATVVDRDNTFCPNDMSVRSNPGAPDRSSYPFGCPFHPFTLGSVWGIQAGWASPVSNRWFATPVELPDGVYTTETTVNEPYRRLFGFPADQTSVSVRVTIRTTPVPAAGAPAGVLGARGAAGVDHSAPGSHAEHVAKALADDGAGHAHPEHPDHVNHAIAPQAKRAGPAPRVLGGPPLLAAAKPAARADVPAGGPRPDLRALPAFGIEIGAYEEVPSGRDYLSFAATVWVAGDSPLVVDGFRRAGSDLMDAYQYFYDAAGNQTGHALVGTMEWDARDGHNHWHFTDFAQYRLLDADKRIALRSGKEAFCLANTDAVDYTLAKSNWRPGNTELSSSCGQATSLAVREVLDIGNGDTYGQFLPGQSFDITDVPNGTYYIEVTANPVGNLYEKNKKNNSALRQVILGGEPGARTVTVPPHEGIEG